MENKNNPMVLGNTNPNSWWNSWSNAFNSSIAGHVWHAMSGSTAGAPQTIGIPLPSRFSGGQPTGPAPAPAGPAVSQQFTNTLAQAMGKPVRLPPPDLSALDAAKGKAKTAGDGITTALAQAMHKPVKLPPPDLSAAQAAAGKAKADGASISAGLAAGIEAGKGAVVAAANDVASAAAVAMAHAVQSRSPSRVTKKIGASMVEGLIVGLQGGQPALQAAAAALGQTVAKAADITAIENTISKAESWVSKDSAMVKWLKAEQGKLEALANKRARLEQEITDSTQIAQSAVTAASIMNAGAYTPAMAGGPVSAYQTITGLGYMAGDTRSFAAQLTRLQKLGLNATSLSQLAQAGAAQGLPIAEGLTQGGAGAIAQINALEKTIIKGAGQIGDVGGPAMYQSGKDLGAAAATGLKSELGAVDAAAMALAQAVVNALENALHIKPPHGGGALPRGGHGTVVHHHHQPVTVHVHGSLVHQQDLADHIQAVMLAKGSQNWQMGNTYPGRAQ
jgi:hypothetical protein